MVTSPKRRPPAGQPQNRVQLDRRVRICVERRRRHLDEDEQVVAKQCGLERDGSYVSAGFSWSTARGAGTDEAHLFRLCVQGVHLFELNRRVDVVRAARQRRLELRRRSLDGSHQRLHREQGSGLRTCLKRQRRQNAPKPRCGGASDAAGPGAI